MFSGSIKICESAGCSACVSVVPALCVRSCQWIRFLYVSAYLFVVPIHMSAGICTCAAACTLYASYRVWMSAVFLCPLTDQFEFASSFVLTLFYSGKPNTLLQFWVKRNVQIF